ncbi:MAG: hypothetical protein OXR67_07985 [Chloroflexota bacterium]|nr:hypothetical protein [Chloroflexota bacterium]
MTEANDAQGSPVIRIQVSNLQGTEFEELELPVDPNAPSTVLPRDLLERLEVPVTMTRTGYGPEGWPVAVQIGGIRIRIGNTEGYTSVVFGDEDQPARVGDLTLKEFFLQLNPETGELEPLVLREVRRLTAWPGPGGQRTPILPAGEGQGAPGHIRAEQDWRQKG